MASKKRILLISQHFYPEIGSAANRMKNIYMELESKGFDVNVLTLEPRYPNKELYENERFWDTDINEEDVIRIEPLVKKHSTSIIKRLFLYIEVMFRFIIEIFRYKKEADYAKAEKKLDWKPRFSLYEGLKKTIQYYSKNHK